MKDDCSVFFISVYAYYSRITEKTMLTSSKISNPISLSKWQLDQRPIKIFLHHHFKKMFWPVNN